jgi:hypothetical protein
VLAGLIARSAHDEPTARSSILESHASSYMLDTFTLGHGGSRAAFWNVVLQTALVRYGAVIAPPLSAGFGMGLEREGLPGTRSDGMAAVQHIMRNSTFIESILARRDRRLVSGCGSGPDTSARGRGAAWRRPRSGLSAAAHDHDRLGGWRRHP